MFMLCISVDLQKMPPKGVPKNSGKENGKKEFIWSDDEIMAFINDDEVAS